MTATEHPDSTAYKDHGAWLDAYKSVVHVECARLRSTEQRWSWARLGSFAAACLVWLPLDDQPASAAVATVALLGVFALAVRRHRAARGQRELEDRVLLMTDEAGRRCGGKVTLIRSHARPADSGKLDAILEPVLNAGETWKLTPQEHDDLDLYAPPVGIFGLLNRTSTSLGARRLRDVLEHPCLSLDRIRARQAAVRRLEEDPVRRLRMMAAAAVLRDQDTRLESFLRALRCVAPLPHPRLRSLMVFWSLPSLAIAVLSLVQVGRGQTPWTYALVALLILNGLLYASLRSALNRCLAPWKTVGPAASGCLHAARQAAVDLPDNVELDRLGERFVRIVEPSVLPSLCRRVDWADSGGMLHTLCNLLFFFDLHVAQAILNRALPNRDALVAGLSALADLEALNSLACFAYESDTDGRRCYPEICETGGVVIERGRHPLLAPERAVPNDVRLMPDTRMWVITGPNMAGKSTLLRMAGVNCLLAQIGTAVTAENMTLLPVRLITDLQVRDNLADDESYFLAEVRQLRRMIVPPTNDAVILGLMDEPFRGTNSEEQVAASLAVVEHLLSSPSFFLVATHEQRLTEFAAANGSAANRHFQERLEEEGLVFDYRLQDGPARTRNALNVLEREGYPDELVARARSMIRRTAETPSS